jgi:hypothetical protein
MRASTGLLIPLLFGCLLLSACERKAPATAPQWIPVRVQILGALTDDDGVRYSASVTPKTQVDLKFKASGYIDSIYETKDASGKLQPVPRGTAVSVTTYGRGISMSGEGAAVLPRGLMPLPGLSPVSC